MTISDNTHFLLSRLPHEYQPWWEILPHDDDVASHVGATRRESKRKYKKRYNLFENRLNLILPEIELTRNKKLIDIGCMIGWDTFALNNKGISATGVDINITYIELAQFLHKYHNLDKNYISFINTDASEFLQNRKNTYDYCICFNVMHHYLVNEIKCKDKFNKYKTDKRSIVFNNDGIRLLKNIQSNCKIAFFQIRLRAPGIEYEEKEDSSFITYLIDKIGFKSYKILQTKRYFRRPNPIYMFNN